MENDSTDAQRKAATAYARAWNTLDVRHLEPLLAEDIVYESQWVFEPLRGREAFLDYLSGKFQAVKKAGSKVRVELAETRPYPMAPVRPQPCAIVSQGEEDIATVLFTIGDGLIRRIDFCEIPPPSTCERTGIFPT